MTQLIRGWTKHLTPPVPGWQRTDPLDRGLVGEWRFDQNTGLMLPDYSGYGLHGVTTGATWATGQYGPYLEYDGINDETIIADAPAFDKLTPNLTLEIFFNIVQWRNQWDDLVAKRDGAAAHFGINYRADPNNNFQIFYNSGGWRLHDAGQANFPSGEWHHLVVLFRQSGANTDIVVYKNGEFLNQSLGLGGNLVTNNLDMAIGAGWAGNELANVKVALCHLHDRIFTAAEVRLRYEICLKRAQPMTHVWTMPWGMAPVAPLVGPFLTTYAGYSVPVG